MSGPESSRRVESRPATREAVHLLVVVAVATVTLLAPLAGVSIGTGQAMATETEAGPDYQIVDFQPDADDDTFSVTATVENVGDTDGSEPVELYVVGETRTVSVDLAPGEHRTVAFSVSGHDLAPGRHGIQVETPTDTREWVFTVHDIRVDDLEATVDDDTLSVTATVENHGVIERSKPVELYVGGELRQTVSVELASGEQRTVEFSVPTDELGPGEISVRVETPTDSRTQSVVIDAHTLRIAGTGAYAEYEFYLKPLAERYSDIGRARLVEVRKDERGQDMYINGGVHGAVSNGSDVYVITGELEFLFFTGANEGRVYLDGERIDPDDYGVKHTLRFVGNGTASRYSFDTHPATLPEESMSSGERDIIDIRATEYGDFGAGNGVGTVYGGQDVYRFIGPLEALYVGGGDPAKVYLDGERIDPRDYGDRKLLRLVGNGTHAEYEFTTTDSISSFRINGGGVDETYESGRYGQYPRDTGAYAKGAVRGGSDQYLIKGDLDGLEAQPGVTVYLDGERIDPANYNETDVHVLKFVGTGDGSTYEFSLDGQVFDAYGLGPAEGLGLSELPVSSNSGFVSGGTDYYYYTGAAEPTSLTVNGNATVYVDGEEVSTGDG